MKKKKRTARRKPVKIILVATTLLLLLGYATAIWFFSPTDWHTPHIIEPPDCNNLPDDGDVIETGVIDFDTSYETTTPITQENVPQLEHIATFYLNRDRFETDPIDNDNLLSITHPSVDYVVYPLYFHPYATRVVVCGEDDEAIAIIEASQLAGNFAFTPDGEFFTITDFTVGVVRFYDTQTFEQIISLDIQRQYYRFLPDIAFHPAEPLIAISMSNGNDDPATLAIYNYETEEEIARFELEASHTQIDFNADGTAIINHSLTANTPVYIWGISSDD